MFPKPSKGFTLVELLVAISIIGVLVALLLPAVQAAREAARRMQCSNNLKQLGLALLNYETSYRCFPHGYYESNMPNGYQPMAVGLLPFIEQQTLRDRYDSSIAPFEERGPVGISNIEVISTGISSFVCPSVPGSIEERKYRNIIKKILPPGSIPNPSASGNVAFHPPENVVLILTSNAAPSDYIVTTGVGPNYAAMAYGSSSTAASMDLMGVMRPAKNMKPARNTTAGVTDGLSNTFLLGERTGGNKVYVGRREFVPTVTGNPDPIYPLRLSNGGGWGDFLNGDHILDGGQPASTAFPPIPGPQGINCNSLRNSSFHSFHVGGCHFLYADGSIHFVVESIEARALAGQITARNAEVLSKE
jgi:prepilin-type N-terminal cleavage/methylation domain-containing protein